jgi:hypothetical protein
MHRRFPILPFAAKPLSFQCFLFSPSDVEWQTRRRNKNGKRLRRKSGFATIGER